MNEHFQCGDNTALVGYLYGESEAEEQRAIEMHLAVCAACTAELAALESTREQLASWVPPDAQLGFQIVRPQASERGNQQAAAGSLRPGAWFSSWSWTQPLPAWMQAAAACAIFAAGVWMGVARETTPPAPEAADIAAASASVAATNAATASDLQALEQRLRSEMTRMRTVAAPSPRLANVNEEELMARIRSMIEESEQRQQRELAIRVAQVTGEVETQRRLDLARIQRTLGQLEGETGAEIRDQRQLVNYLMRVSQQQQGR